MNNLKRHSIVLPDSEVKSLTRLAQITRSVSKTGETNGKPSWRVLIRNIGKGVVKIQFPVLRKKRPTIINRRPVIADTSDR
jgi:hypothetical protein